MVQMLLIFAGVLTLQRDLADPVQGYPERIGYHLDKSTAAGRTLVVHDKVGGLARQRPV